MAVYREINIFIHLYHDIILRICLCRLGLKFIDHSIK